MSQRTTGASGSPWAPVPWTPQPATDLRPGGRGSDAARPLPWRRDALLTAVGVGVGLLIVLATLLGSSGLELVASVLAICLSVLSPMAGMIVLAFVAPIARPLVIPLPGLYVVMMGAMIFALILRLPIDRPRLRRPAPEVLLLAAFVLYVGGDVVAGRIDGSAGPAATAIASAFARLVEAVLVLGVGYIVLRGRSPFPLLAGLLLSAVLGAFVALSQVVGVEGLFGHLVPPTQVVARITGAFDDPNYFGSYLAAMIVLAIGCLLETRSRFLKASLLAIAGLLSVTLLFTQSRGALVAFMAGLVVLAFTRGRRAGLMTIGAIILTAVVAYPVFSQWRFGDAAPASVTDTAGRAEAWQEALHRFTTAPLFGIGFGRFQEEASVGIAVHNWYVEVLAETGVVGFILWSLFCLAAALALRHRPRPAQTIGYSVLAVWMVAGLTLAPPTAFGVTGPVLMALAAAVAAEWPTARRSPTPVSAPASRYPRLAPRVSRPQVPATVGRRPQA
jgi:putative inorganic carbon (hco3(-)) transporter